MSSRHPSFAADILAFFAGLGTESVEVPVLQPADPFLDMAGDDLRRRIFLTESETGRSLCLRPEFTIPVCLDHIAQKAGTPRRYSYLGEVFRQHREGGSEFLQAGIEDLGEADRAEADARAVADAHALLSRVLPGVPLLVTMGDHAMFEALLAALGLPEGWQRRLARAFGSAKLAAALEDLARPTEAAVQDGAVAALIAGGDRDGLAGHIAALMEEAGLSAASGRTPEEIAARLVEKAELRSARLSPEALATLRSFLAIRVPLGEAPEALERFAVEADLSLSAALEPFAARAMRLAERGLDMASVTYDARFGRLLDYYTGLVFEISAPGDPRPLAGGGRYDRLLTLLGAAMPIPGVGFSVWLDRIAGRLEARS